MTSRQPEIETLLTDNGNKNQDRPMFGGAAIRLIWLCLGWVALGFGAVGIVLPVLPTTPFVILAAFCFTKGSAALAERLIRNRVFGPIIADWRTSGAIAPRYKTIAILMMAGAFGLSFAMVMPVWVLVIQVLCMALAASFILSRPSRASTENPQTT
jgi:uncharacterized membrane protein YbaN (DUF454 family)